MININECICPASHHYRSYTFGRGQVSYLVGWLLSANSLLDANKSYTLDLQLMNCAYSLIYCYCNGCATHLRLVMSLNLFWQESPSHSLDRRFCKRRAESGVKTSELH